MNFSPEEREVMRVLGLTGGQWLRHGCAGDSGGIRALSARHTGLVALQAPARLGNAGAELPARIVMLKWGENETAEGPVTVGPKTLAASQFWPSLGFGDVVIDFNHNTVPGHPSYQGEPCKVAARQCALSVVSDVGLVFDDIDWTEEGQKNREHYPDLSPAVKLDENGEVIFCHSAALCRNGAVNGLHLFSAASVPPDLAAKLLTLSVFPSTRTSEITSTDREVMKALGITEERWRRAEKFHS